ncbi:MAG TPA: RES domain-containing protein [Acidimicrobiales bacterium]|nr:RES domain-containing protein [Acidimicrobiales bacterium]
MLFGPLPQPRPPGLRRRSLPVGTALWRIDAEAPAGWDWAGFPQPRHRFDSATGAFRTRYAATSAAGAARERYVASGRYIPSDHRDHHLVRLVTTRRLGVLDLRTEANLDALDVDDRISTAHDPEVWEASHHLADAVHRWWDDLDGLVYRSRTTPASAVNLAFFSLDPLAAQSWPLRSCVAELDDLVLHHRFTIGFDY